jgi:hypothetical protein
LEITTSSLPPDLPSTTTAVDRVGSLARRNATNASLLLQLDAHNIVGSLIASSPSQASPPSNLLKACLRALTALVKFLDEPPKTNSSSWVRASIDGLSNYLRDHEMVLVSLKFLSKFLDKRKTSRKLYGKLMLASGGGS